MRLTLTANTDWYLYNFRLDLARAAVAAGHEVSMVCPDGPYVERLEAEGFPVKTYRAASDGFSLTGNRQSLADITAAYGELQPDLVHLFTPICVLLGSLAASKLKIPYRVAALTGLGHVFTSDSWKSRLVRPGLRWVFRRELTRPGTAVIFQNEGDQAELVEAGVVRAERCHLIRGSGVDLHRFAPTERPAADADQATLAEHSPNEIAPSTSAPAGQRCVMLFASRLLHEKGLAELAEAFAQVRASQPGAELWIAGAPYAPNPSSYTAPELAALEAQDGVRLLGHVEHMAPLLAQVDLVALPSYREGTPKVLLEAAACALPIVATDIPGCRGLVQEGVNGYLVPVGDRSLLAERLTQLGADANLRRRLGAAGREIVAAEFSSTQVIARTLAVYKALLAEERAV